MVVEKGGALDGHSPLGVPRSFQKLHNAGKFSGPQKKIHLRHFPGEGLPIPLGKATHDDEETARSGLFQMTRLKNRVYGLLGRLLDKAACIDENDIPF